MPQSDWPRQHSGAVRGIVTRPWRARVLFQGPHVPLSTRGTMSTTVSEEPESALEMATGETATTTVREEPESALEMATGGTATTTVSEEPESALEMATGETATTTVSGEPESALEMATAMEECKIYKLCRYL